MISTQYQLAWLILLSLSEIIGDFAFESYANIGKIGSFFTGVGGYVGVIYFLIKSLRGSNILLVNAMWDGISALLESAAAIILLKEGFENYIQYTGLVFILTGLFMIKWKPQRHIGKLISETFSFS